MDKVQKKKGRLHQGEKFMLKIFFFSFCTFLSFRSFFLSLFSSILPSFFLSFFLSFSFCLSSNNRNCLRIFILRRTAIRCYWCRSTLRNKVVVFWFMTPCSFVSDSRYLGKLSDAPKMETADSSEIFVTTYERTGCHNLQDHNINF